MKHEGFFMLKLALVTDLLWIVDYWEFYLSVGLLLLDWFSYECVVIGFVSIENFVDDCLFYDFGVFEYIVLDLEMSRGLGVFLELVVWYLILRWETLWTVFSFFEVFKIWTQTFLL